MCAVALYCPGVDSLHGQAAGMLLETAPDSLAGLAGAQWPHVRDWQGHPGAWQQWCLRRGHREDSPWHPVATLQVPLPTVSSVSRAAGAWDKAFMAVVATKPVYPTWHGVPEAAPRRVCCGVAMGMDGSGQQMLGTLGKFLEFRAAWTVLSLAQGMAVHLGVGGTRQEPGAQEPEPSPAQGAERLVGGPWGGPPP